MEVNVTQDQAVKILEDWRERVAVREHFNGNFSRYLAHVMSGEPLPSNIRELKQLETANHG